MSEKDIPTGLYWKDKKTEVNKVVLPFQTIETINESRATREKEKVTSRGFVFEEKAKYDAIWYNRLIWGDNKYIMSSLIAEFAGKIDLIYIDPPFATGSNFSVKIEVGDIEWTKEPSAIEDKAYRDTWGKGLDSFLQMMFDRLIIMRDLLSEKGTIYVHADWHIGSYIKLLLDEIFSKDRFLNEVVWCYSSMQKSKRNWNRKHDNIYAYTKSDQWTFNADDVLEEYENGYRERFKYEDDNGLYMIRGKGGGESPIHSQGDLTPEHEKKYPDWTYRQYIKEGALPKDWWEIPFLNSNSMERLNYATQKPEALLERIIKASSSEQDLIADFFCGSGTTMSVAEKLGRRWIGADLSRYAVHTARKRMLDIEGCNPFFVQNLGKYERQYWQGVTFKKKKDEQVPLYEYLQFILNIYKAEPLSGLLHLHGKKGKRLVHIGSVDAPVTLSEIKEAIAEVKKMGQDSLDILGWEWEMGLHDVVENESTESGVKLRLFYIPRDVMDPKAVESGEITFYELSYLEVEAEVKKESLKVKLKDFAIPNLDLIPEEVRSKIKKWSDYIDYWAVDWDWNEDTFHNMWQSYRTKKERTLELISDSHTYANKGKHLIMVKVIDIFGNDTTRVLEVKS